MEQRRYTIRHQVTITSDIVDPDRQSGGYATGESMTLTDNIPVPGAFSLRETLDRVETMHRALAGEL